MNKNQKIGIITIVAVVAVIGIVAMVYYQQRQEASQQFWQGQHQSECDGMLKQLYEARSNGNLDEAGLQTMADYYHQKCG